MFKKNLVLFFIFILVACTSEKPTYEYMPDMMDSPAVKAFEERMRMPVPGTLPRGFTPYPFTADQGEAAGLHLQNPVPLTKESLKQGLKAYNTYCIVCHGSNGKGQGTIVPQFPMPPTLHSTKVRAWSDGRIFHVITTGQNLMPSYAAQISVADRWAIIHYVRALQRAMSPREEDVKAFRKYLQEGKL